MWSSPKLSINESKSAWELVGINGENIFSTSAVKICQTLGVLGLTYGTFLVALTTSLRMVGSPVGSASFFTSDFFFRGFFFLLVLSLSSCSLGEYFFLVSAFGIAVSCATPLLLATAEAIAVFCAESKSGKYLIFIASNVSGVAVAVNQSVIFLCISYHSSIWCPRRAFNKKPFCNHSFTFPFRCHNTYIKCFIMKFSKCNKISSWRPNRR